MSVAAQRWVLRKSPYSGDKRSLHITLAHCAEGLDHEVHEDVDYLADMARVTRRTALAHLSEMVEDGLLEPLDPFGYRLVIPPAEEGAGEEAEPEPWPWAEGIVLNGLEFTAEEFELALFEAARHDRHGMLTGIVYESTVTRRVLEMIRELVAFAAKHDYLRYGDGEGGALIRDVITEVERYHPKLPKAAAAGPKRPTAIHKRLHKLYERDGEWVCHYCGDPVGCPCDPDAASAVADHVIPKSRGGADDLANLVIACVPCNSAKGDRTPSEWGGPPREDTEGAV